MVEKLPDLSVGEIKAKLSTEQASIDNEDPSVYWKEL